jgi:regulatory protein
MSGTITSILRTDDDPPRLVVFVDGAEAFTVSEELAAELGLAEGAEVAPEDTRTLDRHDDREKAREAALRLLAVRARSEGELDDRLKRKGFDERTSAEVVSRLKNVGLVDDEDFARAWVDEKLRLRPCGPRRLVQELLTRRVPRAVADRVVAETFSEHDELEVARRAAAPKVRSQAKLEPAKRRARLQSFLLRRGFSYEVASTLVKEMERATEGEPDV